jgi:predicted O-methyltransferase YrrM
MLLPWRDQAPGPLISTSLTRAETDELCQLATGRRVLEVGTAYGYSAVAMGLVAEAVTSIDTHVPLRSLQVAAGNLAAYHLTERVQLLVGSSQRWLPALDPGFDLVFIDGDHQAAGVRHDVLEGRKLLKPGGMLACHDYGEDTCPDVRHVLDQLYPLGPDYLVDTLWVRRLEAIA